MDHGLVVMETRSTPATWFPLRIQLTCSLIYHLLYSNPLRRRCKWESGLISRVRKKNQDNINELVVFLNASEFWGVTVNVTWYEVRSLYRLVGIIVGEEMGWYQFKFHLYLLAKTFWKYTVVPMNVLGWWMWTDYVIFVYSTSYKCH